MYIYKTIIFDLDGTLFKTDTVFIKSIQDVCLSRGIEPVSREKILNLIGEPAVTVCRHIFGEGLSDIEIRNIRNELRKIEDKLIPKSSMLFEGVKDMLYKLKSEGYTLCIFTNGSRQYVDSILNTFGIGNYFSIIKSRIEGLRKYQLVKQILDESASCSAIIVGDTDIDFNAANNAGCLSIGVSYGYGGDACKNADFTADNPMEIYSIIKKINGLYNNISTQILNRKQRNKPLIVGINGVDTSGKTAFTKGLDRYLSKIGFKTQLILMDDFHNPSKIRNREDNPIASYFNNAFDLKKIENELLIPIISEGLLDKELTLLDIVQDKFVNQKRYSIDKDTIVLLEGVLLYREPLNKYFDMRLFLDISFDEVLNRASKRDAVLFGDAVIERYKNKYIPIQKQYIEKYAVKDISDIIINNEDYLNPKITKGMAYDKLKDDNIMFEKVEKKHLSEIYNILENEEAAEMLGVISFPDEQDYRDKNALSYAILKENQEFIGIVELFNISWKNRRAELSIVIKPSMRGKGYGYKAINNILRTGFEEYGMNRIWLRVLENNSKAINLYKKAGFSQEGLCRGESLRNGRFINQIQMSILITEWIHH